ncbi:PucR family transcriptional regulator [Phytoactinopolyspora alkaliphila]|uniref:PucR family transcriptional regulator n=1 Tax=Phytoactinopolyspora alkaliphila TaxID=1783498 RepID=A0A6N9YNK1_9ACTN|nr:helix-turn-helix domain-containing protein [Phytoactinopolyspora alkaliphila]NED96527.1 PucR family transcriptional regulator [Phytoactinopolyspora alkaliphila]
MRPELQDIVDTVSTVLARPATLEDRDFNLVAFCSHGDGIDDVRAQSILRRRCSPEATSWLEQFGIAGTDLPVRTPSSPELGLLSRLCLPARWRGVTYGYLWLLDDDHRIDDADVPAAAALATRAGALMAQQARAREEIGFKVRDLVTADPRTAEDVADELGELSNVARRMPVAAVHVRATTPSAEPAPLNLWSLPRSVLAGAWDAGTTLLVPVSGDDVAAEEVAHRARTAYAEHAGPAAHELVVGVGGARPDLAQAGESWREARLAARVGAVVPALRPVASWPTLGIYRMLACGSRTELAEALMEPAVLRLVEHPDPELRKTVETYLEYGGDVQRTAATLNVHRQTVYYRLRRIEQLTGMDLSGGDGRLRLHLGLRMAPLLLTS